MERNDLDLDLRYRRPQGGNRPARLPGNLRQLGAVGRYVPPPLPGAPHTIVRGQIQAPGGTARYLNYMQAGKGPLMQDHATDPARLARIQQLLAHTESVLASGNLPADLRQDQERNKATLEQELSTGFRRENAELFTAQGRPVEKERFILQAGYDKHQFSFVVSVRDSPASILPAYIRDLMTLVERDTQRPLDWLAAVHHDTEHVHTHVLVRGRDRDGKDVYLTTPYLSEGIQRRAAAVAMQYFGLAKGTDQGRNHARDVERQPTHTTGMER